MEIHGPTTVDLRRPEQETEAIVRLQLPSPRRSFDTHHGPEVRPEAEPTIPVDRLRKRRKRRWAWIRSWLLVLPVDLATMAAPALWVDGYWRGLLLWRCSPL